MKAIPALSLNFRRHVPVVLQTEAAECGLACLAMIVSYYGRSLDIATSRTMFDASLKGMTLQNIADSAGSLGLASRAVRAETEELLQLKLPCVLHWEFGHFVVLVRVKRTQFIIHDPARGRRRVTLREFNKSFTGVALEIWPTSSFEPKRVRTRFQIYSLFQDVAGLKNALFQIFVLALGLEVFAILTPIGLQIIIDQAIVSADIDLVAIVVIGLSLLVLLQAVVGFVRSWTTMSLMTRLSIQWEASLFSHMLRLPLAWFEKRHVGDIISRFSSLKAIQTTCTTNLVAAFIDALFVAGMLSMMLLYSPALAGISIAMSFAYILMRLSFFRPYRSASEAELIYWARENSHLMETIRGANSVKALGLEERRRTTWLNALANAVNANVTTEKLDIYFNTTNGLLSGFGKVLILWFGSREIMNGTMSVGMFIAFLSYQDQFATRLASLVSMVFQLSMLSLQGERISDIALAKPERQALSKKQSAPPAKSLALEAIQLGFRYGDGEQSVFQNVSFKISAGEHVAIVGPSGCGKTTLLKILAGLIIPTEGRIHLDGREIHEIGLSHYRQMTACVLQDDQLFAGSLAENIAAFDPQYSQQRVEECAMFAAIDQEISKMPMGYETLVGDMGSVLSGGQKQRILLARAFYRKPHLLFLDEATSHLDESNEAKINESIRKLDITRITVAHRPATIGMADRIINLKGQ